MALIEIQGLFYNPETRKFQDAEGKVYPWTFAWPTWSGPFMSSLLIPIARLSPYDYPTKETTEAAREFMMKWAPRLIFRVYEQKLTFSFTSEPQRSIYAEDIYGVGESFAPGRIISSIIRHGEEAAKKSWLAELRLAGMIV